MTKPANPADRRQFGRRQTSLHAWITVPGRPRLSCVVKDISLGGALLQFDQPSWLPFTFQLTVEGTRFTSMCEIRHTSVNGMGVRFLAAVTNAEVDRLGATGVRSLSDPDAWMGDTHGHSPAQAPPANNGNAVARAFRQRH